MAAAWGSSARLTLVDKKPGAPFLLGLSLGLGLYLLISRKRRRRSDDPLLQLAESFLRLIDPTTGYRPLTPIWLAAAAAEASSSSISADDPPSLDVLPPPVRAAVQELQAAPPELGAAARQRLFCLEEGAVYLNHGSYGAALRLALEAQRYYQDRLEAQPVRFMEEEALAAVRHAQLALARLVHAEPADLAFVPNATTAANAVLRSVQLGPGDLILLASTTYPAVRSAAARVAEQRGAALLEVQLMDVLGQPEEVVGRYAAALRAGGGRVRLAVIDQIVSLAPAHLPVAELCTLSRAHGVPSLVDGAHAVGALPVDIPALGCDYYTSNLHKWLCTPKGAAFLWAAKSVQPGLLPTVTSHGYGLGFQGEFLWSGTADWTAVSAIPTAIAVMQALEPAASRYRHSLLRQAVRLLMGAWGTPAALGVQAPGSCMSAVELPQFSGRPPSGELATWLHAELRHCHGIEVPVAFAAGKMWCRISAQIYNELSDYRKLADAVQQLAAQG